MKDLHPCKSRHCQCIYLWLDRIYEQELPCQAHSTPYSNLSNTRAGFQNDQGTFFEQDPNRVMSRSIGKALQLDMLRVSFQEKAPIVNQENGHQPVNGALYET